MSWFQPVKRDSVITTLDVDDKVFVSTLDHSSYGCCRGLRVASWRIKTWVRVDSAGLT